MLNVQFKNSPFKMIILLYTTLMLLFSFLFSLKISQVNEISFVDLVFLSSSALSGTGLSTINISEDLTVIGQTFLLMEIQIGGIGIMATFAVFFYLFGKNLSMNYQTLMSFDQNQKSLKSIRKLMLFILIFSLSIETIGALLSYISISDMYQDQKHAIFVSFFHSISSFANAGFDLFGDSMFSFSMNSYMMLLTAFLIFFGTIGFPVVFEILFSRNKKFSLFTKLNLFIHVILIIFGTFIFMIFEWKYSLAEFSTYDKFINSLFLSVSARNAGLATFDLSTMTASSLIILSILMFIGGSPSSTGGGIRTTTFGLLVYKFFSFIKGNNDVVIFKKSIYDEDLKKAYSIFSIFLFLFLFSTIVLTYVEQKELTDMMTEVMSALSTTGLSTGITADLTTFSKIWLAVLMTVVRIGVLSLIYGFLKPKKSAIRYKKENLIVG